MCAHPHHWTMLVIASHAITLFSSSRTSWSVSLCLLGSGSLLFQKQVRQGTWLVCAQPATFPHVKDEPDPPRSLGAARSKKGSLDGRLDHKMGTWWWDCRQKQKPEFYFKPCVRIIWWWSGSMAFPLHASGSRSCGIPVGDTITMSLFRLFFCKASFYILEGF